MITIEGKKYEKIKADSGDYEIHSIRLSDSTCFKIGDYVTSTQGDEKGTIVGFEEKFDHLWAVLDNRDELEINVVKHQSKKVPLFTTEDGLDVIEGKNDLYSVNTHHFDLTTWNKCGKQAKYLFEGGHEKFFSNKQAAKDYIIENKPCLSVKDVLLLRNGLLYLEKDLKQLVQTRLNQSL